METDRKMPNSYIHIVLSGAFKHNFLSRLSVKVEIVRIKCTSNSNQLRCSNFANVLARKKIKHVRNFKAQCFC